MKKFKWVILLILILALPCFGAEIFNEEESVWFVGSISPYVTRRKGNKK